MKSFLLFGGLFFIASVPTFPIYAGPETKTPSMSDELRARELVQNLGNPRFKVREEASRQLLEMGRSAKRALIEGKKSSDAEIWNRCSQLLPKANELDLKVRVDAFLADTEGKKEHDLPLWSRFQKIAGSDAVARKLYGEIVKNHALFLEQCDETPAAAGEAYNMHMQELMYQMSIGWRTGRQMTIQLPDLAAIFLTGCDPLTAKSSDTQSLTQLTNLFWQANIQQGLRPGDQSAAFRKLFLKWADQLTDEQPINVIINVIQNLRMKEALPFVIKTIKMKDHQVGVRAQAMICISQVGGKEQAASLDQILLDSTLIINLMWNNVQINTNVSDVALAMAISMSGLDLKDFGYDAIQTQPNLKMAYHYLGFSTDARRVAALIKAAKSKELPASTRATAILALVQYGKTADTKALEPFLKETLVVANATRDSKKIDIELRDVALAVALILNKQDLNDFGFKGWNKASKPKDATIQDFFFATNESREAAQKKWKESGK